MDLLQSIKKLFSGDKRPQAKLPVINVEKRFELMGRVGQGSMSKVWRARDRQTARTLCLKVLDRLKTEKFEARFAGMKRPLEGEILMKLRHVNVVQTFEYGMTTGKEQYIMMELIDGMGLNFLIETKSPLAVKQRVNILCQLADALEYTHKAGYMHRDICPRNVMVTTDVVVKLIDFGLAIPYKPEFCKPGNRTGTTNYMAPELIKRQTTDHRVDMFALGVTAYEMYTGGMPWEKGTSQEILMRHVNTVGTDPRELRPELDKATAEFLMKAIERNPKDRYQTPAEFRDAIRELPELS